MDIAQSLIKSIDSNGVVVDSKAFRAAVRALGEEFAGDVFSAVEYLVEAGMDEDIANDIAFKYIDE